MRHFLLLAACMVCYASYAQTKFKYGKITSEELEMTECSFYPEADAMVLAHTGNLSFDYVDEKGFKIEVEIVKRIKIFNTDGKDRGDISIVLYDPVRGGDREEYAGLRATTYNMEDGKVTKTRLTNDQIFTKRVSDYRKKISFTMPNVQEGSVIEYKYLIRSDYISNLYEWHFQEDMPVAYSQFDYRIPEYFEYRESHQGAVQKLERESDVFTEQFTYRWQSAPQKAGAIEKGTSTMESRSKVTTLIAKDVPPVLEEPFMNNRPNLPARIEFQLISWQMPGGTFNPVAHSYETFNANLLDNPSLGGVVQKGGFAKDLIAALDGTDRAKAEAIYNKLRDHFSYNGVYSIASSSAGRKAFNARNGSVADINLSLVAAWKEAGLDADPVILSTRGHGIPHPVYPNYEDFNYVIGAVTLDGKTYLCDASTSHIFGRLPVRCLNGNGWKISPAGGSWVDLKSNARGAVTVSSVYEIGEDEITATHQSKYEGYDALSEKTRLSREGEDGYKDMVIAKFGEDEIADVQVSNDLGSLKWSVDCVSPIDDPDMIYLKPIQAGTILENSFKREERISSVDFPYSFQRRVIVQIMVPEGFGVAEMPQPALISLPDKAGRFTYSITQNGGRITISSMLNMAKPDYSPAEYTYLKQFYQMVADKNSELIVLERL